MVLNRRFHVLDKIGVYREEMCHIAPTRIHTRDFHRNRKGYISTFPVSHLEHLVHRTTTSCVYFTGKVIACTIFRAVTGYESPCTQITAIVDGHMAARLQNQVTEVTARNTHCLTATILRTGHFQCTCHFHIHAALKNQFAERHRIRSTYCTARYYRISRLLIIAHRHYQRSIRRDGIITRLERIVIFHDDNHLFGEVVVGIGKRVLKRGIGSMTDAANAYVSRLCSLLISDKILISLTELRSGCVAPLLLLVRSSKV